MTQHTGESTFVGSWLSSSSPPSPALPPMSTISGKGTPSPSPVGSTSFHPYGYYTHLANGILLPELLEKTSPKNIFWFQPSCHPSSIPTHFFHTLARVIFLKHKLKPFGILLKIFPLLLCDLRINPKLLVVICIWSPVWCLPFCILLPPSHSKFSATASCCLVPKMYNASLFWPFRVCSFCL